MFADLRIAKSQTDHRLARANKREVQRSQLKTAKIIKSGAPHLRHRLRLRPAL